MATERIQEESYIVHSFDEARWWSRKQKPFDVPWAVDGEDVLPSWNVFSKIKRNRIGVITRFGEDVEEAMIERVGERIKEGGYDCGQPMTKILSFRNGDHLFSYAMVTMYRIDRSHDDISH